MPRIAFATVVACLLAGCTWGSISSLPIQTAQGAVALATLLLATEVAQYV